MGMVGPKVGASAASAMVGPASTLLAGERGHGRNTATATAAETMLRDIKIHTERISVEEVRAGCDLVRLFFLIPALTTGTAC